MSETSGTSETDEMSGISGTSRASDDDKNEGKDQEEVPEAGTKEPETEKQKDSEPEKPNKKKPAKTKGKKNNLEEEEDDPELVKKLDKLKEIYAKKTGKRKQTRLEKEVERWTKKIADLSETEDEDQSEEDAELGKESSVKITKDTWSRSMSGIEEIYDRETKR